MKKIIYLSFLIGYYSANSQTKSSMFFNDLYIGIKGNGNYIEGDVVGLSNYFSDYKFEKDSKDEIDLGFGININKQIFPFLNIGLEYNRGQLTGTELENVNLDFTRFVSLDYNNVQLSTKWYLNRMFKTRLKATEIGVYLMGGFGLINSKGEVFQLENGSDEYLKTVDYSNNSGLLTRLGAGLNMKVSDFIDFQMEFSKSFTNDNSLDGIDYRLNSHTANDNFYNFSLGLNFLLGNKRRSVKKWGRISGVVNYATRKPNIKPKPVPVEKSKITRLEEKGVKTIVYADGKVKKIYPEKEAAKVVSITESATKANGNLDENQNEEAVVTLNKKSGQSEDGLLAKKNIEPAKIDPKSISNEITGIDNVAIEKPIAKKVNEIIVADERLESEIVNVDFKSISNIEGQENKIVLRKSSLPKEIEEEFPSKSIDLEETEEKVVEISENHNRNRFYSKRNSTKHPKDNITSVSSIITSSSANSFTNIKNTTTIDRNKYYLAVEISNDEAVEIQNNYKISDTPDDNDFIVESNHYNSNQNKYEHKVVDGNSQSRHQVQGQSYSKKSPMSNATEININNTISKNKFDSDGINNLSETNTEFYLVFENGEGYLTEKNIALLKKMKAVLNSNKSIHLIIEKETNESKKITKNNTRRLLSVLDYLQNDLNIDGKRIRVTSVNTSSDLGQRELKMFLE